MHPSILGALPQRLGAALLGLALLEPALAQPVPHCPRAPLEVLERFVDADCEACWQAAASTVERAAQWHFDWILPSASGEAAALAVAALEDGRERLARSGGPAPAPDRTSEHRTPVAASATPLRLGLQSGPAWSGYLALRYELSGRAPAGSNVWMAIVEQVAAGDDGTPIARELVRAVAGPFPLVASAGASGVTRLVALRVPTTPQPQRLRGRAWIETREGRIVALAGENCPWPPPSGQPRRNAH